MYGLILNDKQKACKTQGEIQKENKSMLTGIDKMKLEASLGLLLYSSIFK